MEKPTLIEKIGNVISIAGNAILMNLLFLLACLPIVTMGQAWCGLLTAVRYNIRGDKWFDGFKAGFKTRFWRGTIAWLVMLPIDLYLLLDMFSIIDAIGLDIPSVMACIVFGLMIMVTFSLLLLNVYVPTNIGQWLRNAVNMVFKVPLELLVSAVLFWAPFAMIYRWLGAFLYAIMIFLTVYFTLAAAGSTLALKNALLHYLLEARASGTLIADEGKLPTAGAAPEEDTEEEDCEE